MATVKDELREVFDRHILGNDKVVEKAVEEVLGEHQDDPEWIKSNFSRLVQEIQTKAYEIYLESEKSAGGRALREVFLRLAGKNPSAEDILKLFQENFYDLDRFFLSLTQGRRPRAGNVFEVLIRRLFKVLKYPYTIRPVINGRPDFLLPSKDHYLANPLDCIVLTVKRTLRERWRQIVTEGAAGRGFYLATIDESVSEGDLTEMMTSKIYLVVPDEILSEKEHYRKAGNVISFEQFFEHHVDPAIKRWREAGLIEE